MIDGACGPETPAGEFALFDLGRGVRLHAARSRKWKTTLIVARIAASLAEDPTRTALIPFVLARGTERLSSARAIARRLEELYDADLEPDVLRVGDAQSVELRLEVAGARYVSAGGSAPDTLREGIALVADLLFRPARDERGELKSEHVEGEKRNLGALIRGLRDERTEYAIERAREILGRGGPSARYELGAIEDLPAIRAADATARWRALVERHPIDLLVVSDRAPEEVLAALQARIPLEKRASAPLEVPAVVEAGRPRSEPVRAVERAALAQARVCLGFRTGLSYLGEQYAAFLVFDSVFGADAQSRLFLSVREGAGLAYEAATVLDRLKGTVIAHFGTDPGSVERVEALALAELERLRQDLVPAQELENARRHAILRVREIEDDPGLAAVFEYARTLSGRRDVSYRALLDSIRAVTAEDVRDVARRMDLDCVYVLTR